MTHRRRPRTAATEEQPDVDVDHAAEHYAYLCRRGARKFWRPGLERADLEQVAALGLLKAALRFDAATGTPFEAYAWLFVVGELMHYVRDYERIVRIPRRLQALEPRLRRAAARCRLRGGAEPSHAELAAELGVDERIVREAQWAYRSTTPVSVDDPALLSTPGDWDDRIDDRVLLQTALSTLSALERKVIVGRYLCGLSNVELGKTLGIAARRLSRLRQTALARMQTACSP